MSAGFTLLGQPISPAFRVREVMIAPHAERPFDRSEWLDALVVVAAGELELEGTAGTGCRLGAGALLALQQLSLRALRNPSDEPVRLIAVSRPASRAATGPGARRA